jgi:iron complex outermembrane receptor protein
MNRSTGWLQLKSVFACVIAATTLIFATPTLAQDEGQAAGDGAETQGAADLGNLEITGSRISRTDAEGPSPVVVITREDMEKRGFSTVYEALENLTQNTGTLQGESFTNSFTANAQSLSLRNLGGGRTLTLLNGRRVADYPEAFNSQSNFFNYATIPAAAVERIEVLTGSASAVYGSDAIAGVVNIILRDDVVAPTITARLGTTEQGGGDSTLLNFVWGKQWDRASLTIAAEYQDIDAIHGKDRDYLDSVEDAPQSAGKVPFTRSTLVLSQFNGSPTPDDWEGPDPYPGNYYDPGAQACDDLQSQGVPYEYVFRDGSGLYCGRDDFGDETIQNQRERSSAYLNFKYDLTDSTTFYTDMMYWDSTAALDGFHNWWGGDQFDADIVNGDGGTGDWIYKQRIFHPNETGSQASIFEESATHLTLGLEGSFSNFWNWDAGVSYSTNDYHEEADRFKEEVADAMFGGTEMIDVCDGLFGPGSGPCFDVFDASTASFDTYDVLTQADIDAVRGRQSKDSDASVWSVYGQLDGDLVEMKHGALQFAAIVEMSSQEYQITPDDRLLNQDGEGWWGLSGTGGGGDRDRYAVGVEFVVPLLETLEMDFAVRYDQYNDDSDVGGAPTYGVGLKYRPVDTWLLRASYNTSFRAPDMHYLFADESGFFNSARDIYQCRQDAIDNDVEYNELDCDFSQYAGIREGNIDLQEEEGNSLTVGFVYSPGSNLSLAVDYYEIELENAVNDLDTQQMLKDEADCQLGEDTNGNAVDSGSELCVDVFARVTRDPASPAGGIPDLDVITTGGINQSYSKTTGIDMNMDWAYETQSAGDWFLNIGYTHVLSDSLQEFSFDPIDETWRDDKQNFNARSIVNMTVGWNYKKFGTVLYAHRLGSMPNWQETARLGTWTTYNMSATYRFLDDKLIASLIVNNLTDKRPPVDSGFTTWPFFWRGQYNAIGRQMFGQLSYTFE